MCKLFIDLSGIRIKNKVPKDILKNKNNYISNHSSAIDPLILLYLGIHNFLAKEEI